ncbi:hypothetical protein K402DRAFT_399947 [Aulographum hederae CBS 113979]|uniref:F-box domain-containing protein n=1 Tax=Aulographum hederae CBS 113979 TaxID=1176131 RepID=A0A6G1HFS9_9PEZI|nr:hypothetical protein K402DRAFT_399947 [Aulographum hederae CBS 113979]
MPRPPLRLFDLAEELILAIIEQIDSSDALCALARTSPRLQSLTEPYIYSDIFIRTGDETRNLSNLFTKRIERAWAVQNLTVRYVVDDENGMEVLNVWIQHMRKLRTLFIETPCCNDTFWHVEGNPWESAGRIDFVRLFQLAVTPPISSMSPPILQQLNSLNLHSHSTGDGNARYNFDRAAIIFTHPTLRTLKLSCFDIEPDIATLDFLQNKSKTSPLTSLTFEECNVSIAGLEILLSIPKALAHLDVGERMYHARRRPFVHLSHDLGHFFRALAQQADSLTHLSHSVVNTAPRQHEPDIHSDYSPGFSSLTALHNLSLSPASILKRHLFALGGPPNLEHLRFIHFYSAVHYSDPQLELAHLTHLVLKSGHLPPSLCSVTLVTLPGLTADALSNYWSRAENRMQLYKFAMGMRRRGMGLEICVVKKNGNFIPPFLYGEELPVEVRVYASETPMWFADMCFPGIEMEAEVEGEEGVGAGAGAASGAGGGLG